MIKGLFILALAVVAAVVVGIAALLAFDSDDDSNGTTGSVATGPSGSTTGGTAGGLTAQEVLQQAAASFGEATSFHFVLSHENGSTPLPLGLQLETAEGDVGVPDRLAAEVEAEALGINVDVEIIGIEDRTWVTNPFTRDWQELPDTNIRDFADPAALVSGLLPAVMNPELSEGGTDDGVDTHEVTGTMDSGALQGALGIAEPGRDVEVEVWIGKDDMLPRRVRLIGPLSDAEESDVVRQVELSRFDEPVEIMPPE